MLIETLNEPIKVRVDFEGSRMTPVLFKRNGRVIRIRTVNARWEDHERQLGRYFFSVEADGNVYELHLDTRTMTWRLDRVCLNG